MWGTPSSHPGLPSAVGKRFLINMAEDTVYSHPYEAHSRTQRRGVDFPIENGPKPKPLDQLHT